jgi:hypothetical protein
MFDFRKLTTQKSSEVRISPQLGLL